MDYMGYGEAGDEDIKTEVTEEEFLVGPDQGYYPSASSSIDSTVGFVYHNSDEYKKGLRSGMSVIEKGPLLRKIKVIDPLLEDHERIENTFFVGPDQKYYNSGRLVYVGTVSTENSKEGLQQGMIVTSVGPLLRRIKVITHINGERQGSDVSYGGGGKRKKRKYSKKSTKRKSKKKGSKKRRKSKKKTKRRR